MLVFGKFKYELLKEKHVLLNKGLSHLPLNWGEWLSSNPARCLGGLVVHPQYEISNDPQVEKSHPLGA